MSGWRWFTSSSRTLSGEEQHLEAAITAVVTAGLGRPSDRHVCRSLILRLPSEKTLT